MSWVTGSLRGQAAIWVVCLAVLAMLPLVAGKSYGLSLLCQMGIMVIFSLSYNMLLGQTGLLSFGHAAYYGLGAFLTLHALNAMGKDSAFPVTLLPLVGAVAGLVAGLLAGFISTRRAGTTFTMISLGIGEMVAASSLMFPGFFGGEGGVSGNRVVGKAVLGITYGPQIEMYYLIAGWTFVCAVVMYALTHTPLGRLANAVRDNPQRVEFVGYDPRWVRCFMLALSGGFAGIAGSLLALNYEIVTAEALSGHTSGLVLLATFVGGVGYFFGPIIGAVVITLMATALSAVTKAWPFYFGLMFLVTVLYVPGGIASLVVLHRRFWQTRQVGRVLGVYGRMVVPVALLALVLVALLELGYHASDDSASPMAFLGLQLHAEPATWLALFSALTFAALLCRWVWSRTAHLWSGILGVLALEGRA